MALEVSEIGIRVHVATGESVAAEERTESGNESNEVSHAAIVDECVRRVLQTLRARQER